MQFIIEPQWSSNRMHAGVEARTLLKAEACLGSVFKKQFLRRIF